jgi:hypothetical protein
VWCIGLASKFSIGITARRSKGYFLKQTESLLVAIVAQSAPSTSSILMMHVRSYRNMITVRMTNSTL